jgi:dimethylaniline monooxygenase (N-oxide forming)
LTQQADHRSNVSPGIVDGQTWLRALDNLAGTGVGECLGWGWRGWWFWFTSMRLCSLLVGGIWSPHLHRLFNVKKKQWEGAKQAIEKANGVGEEKSNA